MYFLFACIASLPPSPLRTLPPYGRRLLGEPLGCSSRPCGASASSERYESEGNTK